MSALLVDTHVLHWWSAEPERVSAAARTALEEADELAVAAITWYELGWLARRGRISVSLPIGRWLGQLAESVRAAVSSPSVASIAASLPDTFPGDPADRLIYATAVEHGWSLVAKDDRMRRHRGSPSAPTVW